MSELLPGLVAVLGLIGLASIVAPRVGLPPPVLMALAGIAWALLPGLAPVEIAPHVVLSVFLPPLLYSEAWRASWRDFHRWLRPILSLAIGLVAFTILAVGFAAKALIPELPWAVCFLMGAVLSPTDTVNRRAPAAARRREDQRSRPPGSAARNRPGTYGSAPGINVNAAFKALRCEAKGVESQRRKGERT